MHLLQDSNVRNVLVIVSRWYGGILLGPARFMYITDAARGVLEQGGYLQQPRALALTNTDADLAPLEESSSSEEEAQVNTCQQLNLCKGQLIMHVQSCSLLVSAGDAWPHPNFQHDYSCLVCHGVCNGLLPNSWKNMTTPWQCHTDRHNAGPAVQAMLQPTHA